MSSDLPSDVTRFIIEHIEAVEALNLLLLLNEQPGRDWTIGEVSTESRSNDWSAQMYLEELTRRGLVRVADGEPRRFRLEPSFRAIVDSVAKTYRERRVAVITLIYSKPDDPATPDPIRAFADAFKLKRDK